MTCLPTNCTQLQVQQYGIESTTDDPPFVTAQPSSLPPLPCTSPPDFSDDDGGGGDAENEHDSSGLIFSISTYQRRVKSESTYDKKLVRSDSPDGLIFAKKESQQQTPTGKMFCSFALHDVTVYE